MHLPVNFKHGLFLFVALAIILNGTKSLAKTYMFGVVPQFDVRRIHEIWQPVLNAVSKRSGLKFELVGVKDIPDFERDFENGVYDFAYMNPFHLIVANKDVGYLPVLKDVGRKLQGIIVVHKDSPFTSIMDLNNKTVAFPSPNSLGAALIPRAEFKNRFHITIKPKYVRSHTSVYLNCALKLVDAGGGVQETFDEQEEKIKSELRILYKTNEISPHPFVYHPRVPYEDVILFTQALLEIGKSPLGEKMLAEIPVNQLGKADMADYESLKTLGLDEFYIRK